MHTGGIPWASICEAYIKLYEAKDRFSKIIYIDNMYHQQHNTDTVFNKLQEYYKTDNGYKWVLDALNFKADVKDNWDRIKKIQQISRKDGVKALRQIDRMYIELLKASGDKSYEAYYGVNKKEETPEQKMENTVKAIEIAYQPFKDPQLLHFGNIDEVSRGSNIYVGNSDSIAVELINDYFNSDPDYIPDFVYFDHGYATYATYANNSKLDKYPHLFVSKFIWAKVFGSEQLNRIP